MLLRWWLTQGPAVDKFIEAKVFGLLFSSLSHTSVTCIILTPRTL